jgi:hypothetical protein
MLFGKGKDVLYASILSRIQVQTGMIHTGSTMNVARDENLSLVCMLSAGRIPYTAQLALSTGRCRSPTPAARAALSLRIVLFVNYKL